MFLLDTTFSNYSCTSTDTPTEKNTQQMHIHTQFLNEKSKISNKHKKREVQKTRFFCTCNACISVQCNFLLIQNIIKCWPPASRIIFGVWTEQLLMANDTFVDAAVVEFVVFAGEWAFGAGLLCHLILNWCQTLAQILLRFHGPGVFVAFQKI